MRDARTAGLLVLSGDDEPTDGWSPDDVIGRILSLRESASDLNIR